MKRLSTGQCIAALLLCGIGASGCSESTATMNPMTNVRHGESRPDHTTDSAVPDRSPRVGGTDQASSDPLTVAERRQADGDLEGALQVLREAHQTSRLDLRGQLQLVRLNQAIAFRRADAMDGESARVAFLETGRLALAIVAEFPRLSPDDSETVALALYNAACSSAFLNDSETAVDYLGLAVDYGFSNFDELEQDSDLDSIRPLTSFQAIRDRLRVLQRAKIDASIRRRAAELTRFEFEFECRDLDGRQVRSADYRGRPVVVFFWISGLAACQEQARQLVALRRQFDDQSLVIVGLTCDRFLADEDSDQLVADIRRTAAVLRVDFPCLLGDEPTKMRIPNVVTYPSLLFLDCEGTPRLMLSGPEELATLVAAAEWITEQPAKP